MRSRTEGWWAAVLDGLGVAWDYEAEAFADGPVQYLPDFVIHGRAGPIYVEVKGKAYDPAAVLKRMEVVWASNPAATLVLIEDSSQRFWIGYSDFGWGGPFDGLPLDFYSRSRGG